MYKIVALTETVLRILALYTGWAKYCFSDYVQRIF